MSDLTELQQIAAQMQELIRPKDKLDRFITTEFVNRFPPVIPTSKVYPNRDIFRKKKLIVLCGDRQEYINFCRDKYYSVKETMPINHANFNLARGMDNGYYTMLPQFLYYVSGKDREEILTYLRSHNYSYIPVEKLP